jgi:isoleucyl-tRNA synthetase
LTEKILGWYEGFEFHRVYHAVNEFAVVDLSNFYLDVLKDRMYTFAPTSKERRSAQTVLWQIAEALVRLVAPIMTFTADEVWEHLPAVAGREASVHLALFPKPEEIFSDNPSKLLEEWKRMFAIRNEAFAEIEVQRKDGEIGKGTEARVNILANFNDKALLDMLPKEELAEFLNVSAVNVVAGSEEDHVEVAPHVLVYRAHGAKCNRCWRFTEDTADYGIWKDVCGRCRSALKEMGVAEPQAEVAQ